jgi:hypothetical protein
MAHSSLRNHNKLKDLAEFLDIPEPHAVGLLVCLWWAVYETKAIGPDGIMYGWAERHIARQAGWDGPPTIFINALFEAHLIDRAPGDEWAIHDYSDWAPEYLKKRWIRGGWDGEKPILEPCEPYCPDNGRQRQTTADCGRQRKPTQPNATEPNVTKPKEKKPKKEKPLLFPDDPAMQKAADEWIAQRKKLKKPLTDLSIKALVKKQKEIGSARMIAMIEYTILEGWQGLREPEASKKPDPNPSRLHRADWSGIKYDNEVEP